jgi:hypothetical protein
MCRDSLRPNAARDSLRQRLQASLNRFKRRDTTGKIPVQPTAVGSHPTRSLMNQQGQGLHGPQNAQHLVVFGREPQWRSSLW